MDYILKVSNLYKEFKRFGNSISVLKNINFLIERASTLSIVGPSGSGKTTLLGLCAGLDKVSSGTIELNGLEIGRLDEDRRAEIRNQYIGFVFQNFQLLPTLTALENIMIPMELKKEKNVKKRALDLLDKVGLGNRGRHFPSQLSGGEQQRVALARAFANNPQILFADEPTGNLDAETSTKVINLLFDLNKEMGTTLVLVTHDLDLASKTQRIVRIKGGEIFSTNEAIT